MLTYVHMFIPTHANTYIRSNGYVQPVTCSTNTRACICTYVRTNMECNTYLMLQYDAARAARYIDMQPQFRTHVMLRTPDDAYEISIPACDACIRFTAMDVQGHAAIKSSAWKIHFMR
jgi:hypothetical protein